MKQDLLNQMYGSTPDSFKHRVACALKETEEQSLTRKFRMRTVLIAAIILVMLMAVAYAAFSSRVADFFGTLYGKDRQEWLNKGDVATPNQPFTLDGVTFTLEEVVYRDNGLYGVGSIRPSDGSTDVIMSDGQMPDHPYGYDLFGAGGGVEVAPAGSPTYADMAKETGGKMLRVRALPDLIGVDGGVMLSPQSIGSEHVPQRDGSIRFFFELSDAYAVEEGQTYTIQMWASLQEIAPDGKLLSDTLHGENWTVEITPTPISDAK